MDVIGEVYGIQNECAFEWSIEDFSTLSVEGDKCYHSPFFYFANELWYLLIHPNGQKEKESIGYIAVYLCRKYSGLPINLDFSLTVEMVNEHHAYRKKNASVVFENRNKGWGLDKLLNRSEFLDNRFLFDLPDVLTLIFTMKTLKYTADAISEKVPGDFEALMLSGDFSDIVIKVKGEEFPLHRAILAARNPFFHCMFTNDMKEKITGIVSIEDCEPNIFRTFIYFIYTGKVDKLVVKNVRGLYEVSHKYQDNLLKKKCLDFMMKTLSDDTFSDYIIVALKYEEKKLLEKAMEIFTSRPNKIV